MLYNENHFVFFEKKYILKSVNRSLKEDETFEKSLFFGDDMRDDAWRIFFANCLQKPKRDEHDLDSK